MPPNPLKNQEECDQLVRLLSPSEITSLLSAIKNDKLDDHRCLFLRAAELWNFPVKDLPYPRTSLARDLGVLSEALACKAKERRQKKPQTVPDHLMETYLSCVRSYSVADLRALERDKVKMNLERVIKYRNELKGSRIFPQLKAVDGIITRAKSLVIELEDM